VNRKHTVLVTGFGPFPGAPFNPSGPLARKLAAIRRPALADIKLHAHVFPTSYRAVDQELPALIAKHHPDAILMFGLATRSRHVRIETQARNTLSSFPDASGRAAKAPAIAPSKQSSLPIRAPRGALLHAARRGPIPARLSRDAGRYLCNYLYWRGLEAAGNPGGPRIVVFVHIPNVRRTPSRKGAKRRHVSQRDLATTGEAILCALSPALNRHVLQARPGS
jgi:pyroglutamyl-peptidase